MPFVLNKKKGTWINHPSVGKLKGGIAYEIRDDQVEMMKNIINVVIFDEVEFIDKRIETEVVIKDDDLPTDEE